ncbi:Tryptophan synthase alpha chain [Labilithrix luteola]|uniref:Tryptophan synthase alpha chain n=1 Tax=Labilithrix luteola TaxID=1391654 RepID=A0A0K1PJF9_9BACT|nr:hypothetical protein [Labilithrix luteola]AKU93660.1 Tryptophan synthase alpha chain [Labilithrix luteola]
MKQRKIIVAAVSAVAFPLVVLSACADSISAGYDPPPAPGPTFVSPDAADEAIVSPPAEIAMCNSYECPAPHATCTDKPGLCNTNLDTDVANCGACGTPCAASDGEPVRHATPSCAKGECQVTCDAEFGNCNGEFEDGCEASLESDPANCGACGNACKDGEVCWRFVCGCPPGYAQCGDTCAKLDEDGKNCGACGNVCGLPDADAGAGVWPCDAGALPPHFGPVCLSSACKIGCTDGYGDCNADRCGDGCETNLANDANNCGACGHACAPGQGCVKGKCECEDPNFTFCGGRCVDTLSHPDNCGSCGHVCPGGSSLDSHSGYRTCVQGRCSFECSASRADCDLRLENGCEVDILVDPRNCGGCGVRCDIDGGQPCIDGHCLMKPCDADGGVVF